MLKIDNVSISTPIVDILTIVKSNLTNGKLKDIRAKNNEIAVTCPFHNNGLEKNPDCYIYTGEDTDTLKTGSYHCFACSEKGPLFHFIAGCFGWTDDKAKEWLIDNFGDGLLESGEDIQLETIDIMSEPSLITLDERILDKMEPWHPYMEKRKITREVAKRFQIKYDPATKCIVFPVRDDKGNLVMLTRRSVESKKFIIDANKSKPVYLLNHLKELGIDTAIVCESQINTLTCYSYNLPSIALFGTGSENQYNILNKSPIRHYILCFDGDAAGDKGIKNFIKNIRKDVFVDVVKMPSGKDVNDLTKDEFLTLLQNNFIDVNALATKYLENIIN